MKLEDYIFDAKMEVSGGVLNLEISDKILGEIITRALHELQRYIDEYRLITVPFAKCIDLDGSKVARVRSIYRTNAPGTQNTDADEISDYDPMYAQMWSVYSLGDSMYNLNNWVLNYASYATLNQLSNTTSTDLAFKYDKSTNKIYINATDNPKLITIEYIPVLNTVEDVTSDYWQDILRRLSIAYIKIALGRIRSKFTQANALWTLDGPTLLEEGKTELTELREQLRTNSSMILPID